jgi:hypothetical protein
MPDDYQTPDVDRPEGPHCLEHSELMWRIRRIEKMQGEVLDAIVGPVPGGKSGFQARLDVLESWRRRMLWFGTAVFIVVLPVIIAAASTFAWKMFAHIEGLNQTQQANARDIRGLKNQHLVPGPQGEQGEQGEQGTQGDSIVIGIQGPSGPSGPSGATGATGAHGGK